MGGLFKKQFDSKKLDVLLFDGAKELEDVPAEGALRLVTSGLSEWKRREAELVAVPAKFVSEAAAVLRRFAEYTVTEKQVQDGQTFAGAMGPFVYVVKSFETESHGVAVSRLGDALATELPAGPARAAIATARLVIALARLEDDSFDEEARQMLLDSVEFFPGQKAGADSRRIGGGGYNTENFLTYVALASCDSEQREVWLQAAFERASQAIHLELGVDEFPEVPRDQLVKDGAQLVIALQTAAGGEPWGPERMRAEGLKGAEVMAMLPAPSITMNGSGAVRFVGPLPFPFRSYFYEEPVRSRLRSDELLGVAADLYALGRQNPAWLLARTAETRELYRGKLEPTAFGSDAEPEMSMPFPGPVPTHLPCLSRILCELGRLLAAGLDVTELRAHFLLNKDQAALERGDAKLDALEELEGQHYQAALSL